MTDAAARTSPVRAGLTYPWWLVATLLSSFLALAIATRGDNTLSFDLRVSLWVQNRGAWAQPLADVGNWLGEARLAISLLIVGLAFGLIRRSNRVLWFLLFAAIGRLLATFLKIALDSPRPTGTQVSLSKTFDGFGFPSGHATTSALVLGSLAFLIAIVVPDARLRWTSVIIASIGVAATSFARMYVGAHWFTDTLGGAMVGMTIVLVAANVSAATAGVRSRRGIPPGSSQIPAR